MAWAPTDGTPWVAGEARGQSVAPPILPPSVLDGLVLHLPFDDGGQPSWVGTAASLEGNVLPATGRFGAAVSVRQYGESSILLPDGLFDHEHDFSIAFWLRMDDIAGGVPAILSNQDLHGGEQPGLNLGVDPDGTLDVHFTAKGAEPQGVQPFGALSADRWQHISLTVDRDGSVLVYVDGIVAGEIDTTSIGDLRSAWPWRLLNDGTGADRSQSASNLRVDDLAVWDRAVTASEIELLAHRAIPLQRQPGDFNHDSILAADDVTHLMHELHRPIPRLTI